MTENHHPQSLGWIDPESLIAAVDSLLAPTGMNTAQTPSESTQTPDPSAPTPAGRPQTRSRSSRSENGLRTRWKPGQSGNPLGRPRRAPDGLATPAVLRALTMRVEMEVDGRARRLGLREAMVRATAANALAGDTHARRDLMQMLADAERARVARAEERARRMAARAVEDERAREAAARAALLEARRVKDRARRRRWEERRRGELETLANKRPAPQATPVERNSEVNFDGVSFPRDRSP